MRESVPSLAHPEHVLHAGPANGDLLAWPTNAIRLGLGAIPLSLQSAFIQARISGPDGDSDDGCSVSPSIRLLMNSATLAALASHMGLRAIS